MSVRHHSIAESVVMRGLVIALILTNAITALATYWVLDPMSRAAQSQRAVIDAFVTRYCHPKGSPEYLAGELGILSKLTIETGVGPLARAEYLKCKAGLS